LVDVVAFAVAAKQSKVRDANKIRCARQKGGLPKVALLFCFAAGAIEPARAAGPAADVDGAWDPKQARNLGYASLRWVIAVVLSSYDVLALTTPLGPTRAVILRFVVERLSKRTKLGVWKSSGRSIGMLAFDVVVQHRHHQPLTVACARVLQHLLVAS
jgi:hypothetical protein